MTLFEQGVKDILIDLTNLCEKLNDSLAESNLRILTLEMEMFDLKRKVNIMKRRETENENC